MTLCPISFLPIPYGVIWVFSRIHLHLCQRYTLISQMVALAPVLRCILLDRVACLCSTGSVALGMKQGGCSRRVPPFSQRRKKLILVGFIKESSGKCFVIWTSSSLLKDTAMSLSITCEAPPGQAKALEVLKVARFYMISHYLIAMN